ncbi:hypothetical protein Syun_004413 [Stephania yunnanensis]|uniref:Protein kinase domain-containing protein n=1 Tax=Stephania yunnanensis TaxID=152371 RepID=A0AAP0Q4X6_9MAGN
MLYSHRNLPLSHRYLSLSFTALSVTALSHENLTRRRPLSLSLSPLSVTGISLTVKSLFLSPKSIVAVIEAATRPSGLPSPSAGDWSLRSPPRVPSPHPKPSPLFAVVSEAPAVYLRRTISLRLWVMGTYGYCALEYARTSQLTLKSDVYSFGVVLLELITGRRAIDTAKPNDEQNLVSWAKLQKRRQELTQTTPDRPVDDEAVYYKVAGVCPKGRVYSLRSLGRKKRRYVDPYASIS